MYTVSTKKLHPCIRCHNSGKQRRILTNLRQHWDVELQTSHQISAKSVNICNSYSKFSKVTQKHKSPLWAQAWLTVKCASVRIARCQHTCVQNVHRVLEQMLEDVVTTAWLLHRWPPGGNVPTLWSGVTSAGRRHGTHTPAASPKSGSRRG